MDSGPCGNYCNGVFTIVNRNPRLNEKKYKTMSSTFTDLKNALVIANETNFNEKKKHNSYTRYLLRKKGIILKCQNC